MVSVSPRVHPCSQCGRPCQGKSRTGVCKECFGKLRFGRLSINHNRSNRRHKVSNDVAYVVNE